MCTFLSSHSHFLENHNQKSRGQDSFLDSLTDCKPSVDNYKTKKQLVLKKKSIKGTCPSNSFTLKIFYKYLKHFSQIFQFSKFVEIQCLNAKEWIVLQRSGKQGN